MSSGYLRGKPRGNLCDILVSFDRMCLAKKKNTKTKKQTKIPPSKAVTLAWPFSRVQIVDNLHCACVSPGHKVLPPGTWSCHHEHCEHLLKKTHSKKPPALNDPRDSARTPKDLLIAAVRKPHISDTTDQREQRPQGTCQPHLQLNQQMLPSV